jgi:hypothetical protein
MRVYSDRVLYKIILFLLRARRQITTLCVWPRPINRSKDSVKCKNNICGSSLFVRPDRPTIPDTHLLRGELTGGGRGLTDKQPPILAYQLNS